MGDQKKDEKKNEKKYKVKRYDFRSDTLNVTPGYRVISLHFWPVYEHPTKPGEDWWYDFNSDRGRVLYETPTKTDTVYYNTPDKFIRHDTGYMPVGTTKDQEESKKWWYKWLEWANPADEGALKIKQNELKKHLQGGTMNQQQGIEQLVVQLVQAAAAGDQKATQQIEKIMQAAQLGNQEAIQIALIIQKVVQAMQAKQGVKAQLGAKLDYINKLKGNCPDGLETYYFKEGGQVKRGCKPCMEKAKEGKKLDKKMNEIQKFKAQKGADSKKFINPNDTVNTKFGPRDLNGNTKYPKYDTSKENYDTATRIRVHEKDGSTEHEGRYWSVSKEESQKAKNQKTEKKACGSKLKKKEVTKHWGGGTVARGGLTNLQYSGTWGNRGKGNEIQSAVERGLSWLGIGPSLKLTSQYYLVDANGNVVKELNPTSTGIAPTPGKGGRVNKVATQTTKVGQQLAEKVYKKMPGYLKNSEDFYHADGTWAGTKKPLWADDIDNAFIMESLGSLK